MKKKRIQISYLLRPHWKTLTVAFIAVLGESAGDLLEPWPLKVVFDYVLGSRKMPGWLAGLVNSVAGHDKVSILYFAAFSVIAIAAVGALGSYGEKYLTTSVGQRVMHDLRRTLYHHIQRLSLSYHDRKKGADYETNFWTAISSTVHRHLTFGRCFYDLGLFAGVSPAVQPRSF